MDLNKANVNQILNRLFFFTLLNFSLNLFGFWFNKLITKETFVFPESIANEFVIPILIQSLLFVLCFGTACLFLKNKKLSWLVFVAFQLVACHIAFFSGIKFNGGVHFETKINHLGLRYLSYNGQYLIDFIFTKMPLSGNFDNGVFKPDSSVLFYIQWVLSIIIYYTATSWFSVLIATFFTSKSETIKIEEPN